MNSRATEVRIRRMSAADLERVMEIAESLRDAPRWPVSAYWAALDPLNTPRRIALVAEEPETDAVAGFAVASLLAPQAELESIAVAAEWQRRGVGAQGDGREAAHGAGDGGDFGSESLKPGGAGFLPGAGIQGNRATAALLR